MRNVSHSKDFCRVWDAWEQGRDAGLSLAIEMVEKAMCQKGSLGALYDSLLDAKLRLDAEERR